MSAGDMRIFFSNSLVGGMTTLALLLLFWPAISRLIALARGKSSGPRLPAGPD
jgi:putative tricarboxylic transport membrane protein